MISGRVYKTHAIVLKRRNVGEADRTLTLFTKEYGRMNVIAKGVRRVHSRRAAHLEVFSHVSLVIHKGKTWDSVTEAMPINGFPVLRASLPRVSAGYYLCELVDALLPQHQEHRDIYMLLLCALSTLDTTDTIDPITVTEQFALDLLRTLGYLAPDRVLSAGQIEPYIERIIEKRLRSPKIMARLSGTISL